MREGNKSALKYKDLNDFYYSYEGDKPRYSVFMQRVNIYGYTKEDAIKLKAKERETKSHVDDNGRVCTKCNEYKTRDKFSKSKSTRAKRKYTTICKECRNEQKRQYRLRTGYSKDHEYKQKKRKLNIGQQIMFNNEVREILDYKLKKGYTIKSLFTGETRKRSSSDNRGSPTRHNCVRSYRVLDNLIQIQEEKKEEVIEKPKYSLSLDDMFEDDYYF